MGATNVSFTMAGDSNTKEVRERFDEIREECLYEYGHDPYNGTFSTIRDIKFSSETFDDIEKAEDYCLEKAEKWEYAIACKYKDKNGKLMWLVAGWAAE